MIGKRKKKFLSGFSFPKFMYPIWAFSESPHQSKFNQSIPLKIENEQVQSVKNKETT